MNKLGSLHCKDAVPVSLYARARDDGGHYGRQVGRNPGAPQSNEVSGWANLT